MPATPVRAGSFDSRSETSTIAGRSFSLGAALAETVADFDPADWTPQSECEISPTFCETWLIANTGLRRDELLGLRSDDIDLGGAMIVPAVHLDHWGFGHTWQLCRRRKDVRPPEWSPT